MSDPKNNGRQAVVRDAALPYQPEDVLVEVKVVLTRKTASDGKSKLAFLEYPTDDLPMALSLLAKGVDIAANLVKEALGGQEPPRVIPFSGPLPPGMKLR